MSEMPAQSISQQLAATGQIGAGGPTAGGITVGGAYKMNALSLNLQFGNHAGYGGYQGYSMSRGGNTLLDKLIQALNGMQPKGQGGVTLGDISGGLCAGSAGGDGGGGDAGGGGGGGGGDFTSSSLGDNAPVYVQSVNADVIMPPAALAANTAPRGKGGGDDFGPGV